MRSPYACAVAIFAAALAFWLPAECQAQSASLGRVYGEFRFSDVTPEVAAYLQTYPVIPEFSDQGTIELRPVDPASTVRGQSRYQPENTSLSANMFSAASYDARVEVGGTDDRFLISADTIGFSGIRDYRFGAFERDPTLSAAHICGPVPSTLDDPDGIQCDVSECAQVVSIRLRLTGAAADLDGLEPTTPPVNCSVYAEILEEPGAPKHDQAAVGVTHPLNDLRGDGQLIPLLVRADGSPVSFRASCEAKPRPGEQNFRLNSMSGLAPFTGLTASFPLDCPTGGAPGQGPEVAVDVPVFRDAGMVTGLFDLNGVEEAPNPHVEVRSPFVFTGLFHHTDADPVPAGNEPTTPWEIYGVPSGNYEAYASAITADGNNHVRFPSLGGENAPPVTVLIGETVDLESTFVARPMRATGSIVLHDPTGNTDLAYMQNPEFYADATDRPWAHRNSTSFVKAFGVDVFASEPPEGESASGQDGLSYGRLRGAWDAATKRVAADYDLLLVGISPAGGDPNGSDAKQTPWDVVGLNLRLREYDGSQQLISVNFNRNLRYEFEPPEADDTPPTQIPEQNICFGKISLQMEVDPGVGSLHSPEIHTGDDTPISATTSIPGSVYTADGLSYGTPRSPLQAGPVATTDLTLPEGIQYAITPKVRFVSPQGDETRLTLHRIDMPETGAVACGQSFKTCLQINDPMGDYTPLSISISPTLPYCRPNSDFTLSVSISSGGTDVDRVSYTVDDGTSQVVCAGTGTLGACGSDPSFSLDVSTLGLTSGEHTIAFEASTQGSCVASFEETFRVPDTPLDLPCTSFHEVVLGVDQTELAADDGRIAPYLQPEITGDTCGLPKGDVIPRLADIAAFPIGDTDITFTATEPAHLMPEGGLSCTTTVRVIQPGHLALALDDSVVGYSAGDYSMAFSHSRLDNIKHGWQGRYYYGIDGSDVRRVSAETGAYTVLFEETEAITDFALPYTDVSSLARIREMTIDGETRHFLAVRDIGTPPGFAYEHPLLSPPTTPTLPALNPPKVAWGGPDGEKVYVGFDFGAGDTLAVLLEWSVDGELTRTDGWWLPIFLGAPHQSLVAIGGGETPSLMTAASIYRPQIDGSINMEVVPGFNMLEVEEILARAFSHSGETAVITFDSTSGHRFLGVLDVTTGAWARTTVATKSKVVAVSGLYDRVALVNDNADPVVVQVYTYNLDPAGGTLELDESIPEADVARM